MKQIFLFFFIFCIAEICTPFSLRAQNKETLSLNGLPAIYITLQDPDVVVTKEDKLVADMRIENAYGSDYGDDQLYNGLIEISGRGNSTWGLPKRPYNIDLIDKEGEDNPSALLGMPADEEWALIANYSDKSLMRIPIAYYLGNAIGMDYSPRLRFVEVYLNGDYKGLYCLCEKIKKSDDREDVKKLTDDEEDQVEPRVTGGYIVEVDQPSRLDTDDKYIVSGRNNLFAFKYPKKKKITDQQMEWFRRYVDTVESALYGTDFKDAEKGYRRYMDIPSFVDWYLVDEFAKSNDAIFFSSVYMHKNRNGKLKMGPLWDFDLAFGNIDYNNNFRDDGFWIRYSEWISRLSSDEYFLQKVSDRFDQIKPVLDSLPRQIGALAEQLKSTGAIERNFARWPILGKYVWPNYPPFPQTYDGEIRRLTDWITNRIEWLNEFLPVSKEEQCLRLQSTRPHISVVNTDEFEAGNITKVRALAGYNKYFWNGQEQTNDTLVIHPGEKYWLQLEDDQGCKSLISDTLYYTKPAQIIADSLQFVYDDSPKHLYVSTVPPDLPVKYTYNGDSSAPVVPGEYAVTATVESQFFKGSIDTTLIISKASQVINFPALPDIIYIPGGITLNATASSGLPVQYIITGEAVNTGNYLKANKSGGLKIQTLQPGNEFYNPTDTLSHTIWAEYANDFNKNIQVFPSPFSSQVTLIYSYDIQTYLTIFTARGRYLKGYILSGNQTTLNLGFLPKGVYIFRFTNSKGKGDIRVVKQ